MANRNEGKMSEWGRQAEVKEEREAKRSEEEEKKIEGE